MSFAGWGLALAVVSAGASASQAHQTKKTAGHAKDRAVGRSRELSEEASAKTALDKKMAETNKRKRALGVGRNLNVFGSSMNDAATRAKKMLTGE